MSPIVESSRHETASGSAVDAAQLERGRTLADLSSAIVRIHKQFYGKGPTKARSHLSHDLLVVVLDGGFTRGEHTLTNRGHEREVLQSRLAMQRAVEGEFRDAVETILGRSVRSFLNASDPSNDLQVEVFVLAPRESDPERDVMPNGDLFARAQLAREQHREILGEHRALRSEQEASRRAVHDEREQHR